MTDNLVQATARAIAKEDRYYYSYGDEYYEGTAKAALAIARPIIERETLAKAAGKVRSEMQGAFSIIGDSLADAIRALGGGNGQDS